MTSSVHSTPQASHAHGREAGVGERPNLRLRPLVAELVHHASPLAWHQQVHRAGHHLQVAGRLAPCMPGIAAQ